MTVLLGGAKPEDDPAVFRLLARQVQDNLNKAAGIGLKAQAAPLNTDRVNGIIARICAAESFDKAAWVLGDPVRTFSQSVVDDTLERNARFQYDAGLSPKIVRKAEAKACKWCRGLAGRYEYPRVPNDVYRRHENCRCVVEYDPGGGVKKRQNVHTKRWKTAEERELRIQNARRLEAVEDAKKFKRTFQAVPQDRVVETMRQDAVAWISSLSDSERASLVKYTGNDDKVPKFYQRINAMLRGAEPEDLKLRRHADIISGALKRSVLGENVICYRGLDANPYAGFAIGDTLTLDQFTSTSITESSMFRKPVKMVIYAKQGTKGAAYIEAISKYPHQNELLFDKDSIYRVLSNQTDLIELEVQ